MTDTSTPTTPAAEKPSGILTRAKASATRERKGIEHWTFLARDEIAELLTGSPFEVDSYLQAAYRVIADSADLRRAVEQSPSTVMGAIMLGARLQLPIGGPLGQFYLTPRSEGYGNDKRSVCVPMIGYRGFFELGYRSGRIRSFDYIIRREGDTYRMGASSERGKFFDWEQFADGEFDELDENGERRPLTGVVALAYTIGSTEPSWQFMSRAAIEKRRPGHWKSTPWNPEAKAGDNSEAMYVKTPHRELAKFLQLSVQSAQAVAADETISLWNRATGAIETLPPGTDAPQEAEGTESDQPAEPRGRQSDSSASASERPQTPPEAANGRVAPQRDPRPDTIERLPDDADYEPWLARLAEAEAGRA